MKKTLFSFILFISAITLPLCEEQNPIPSKEIGGPNQEQPILSDMGLSIGYISEGYGIPFTFFPTNPGGTFGVEFTLKRSGVAAFIQSFNLGYFYNINFMHSIFLNTESTLKFWIMDRVTLPIFIGVGVHDDFYADPEFKFDGGIYKQIVATSGEFHFIALLGFGLGYDFSRLGVLPIEILLRYQTDIQFGFHESIPMMLFTYISAGLTWHL